MDIWIRSNEKLDDDFSCAVCGSGEFTMEVDCTAICEIEFVALDEDITETNVVENRPDFGKFSGPVTCSKGHRVAKNEEDFIELVRNTTDQPEGSGDD